MSETVTVVRSTTPGRDENNDWISSSETRSSFTALGVAPRQSEETGQRGRQGVVVGLTVYAPPGERIRATDTLEIRGELYDVEGEPGLWISPFTGEEIGTEVALTRRVG